MPLGDLHAVDLYWRCLCWLIRRNGTVDKPHSRKKMVFGRRWIFLESDHFDNWFWPTLCLHPLPRASFSMKSVKNFWGYLNLKSFIGNHVDPQVAVWSTDQLLVSNISIHSCETFTKFNKIPLALPTSCCLRLCVLAGKSPIHSIAFLALDLIWQSLFFFF